MGLFKSSGKRIKSFLTAYIDILNFLFFLWNFFNQYAFKIHKSLILYQDMEKTSVGKLFFEGNKKGDWRVNFKVALKTV
jgi:hypothetical protein